MMRSWLCSSGNAAWCARGVNNWIQRLHGGGGKGHGVCASLGGFLVVFRRRSRLIVRTLGELPAAVRENVLCNIIWALGEYFEEFLDPEVGDRRFLSHDKLSKDQRVFFGVNLVGPALRPDSRRLFFSRGVSRAVTSQWASL